MNIFDFFKKIHKYMFTIRNVTDGNNNFFVFDMKFPSRWNVLKHLQPEEQSMVKLHKQDDEKIHFIAFFTPFTEEEVNKMYERIIYIINKSVEEEKKAELLNIKIKELKERVVDMSLEELQQLVFKTENNETENSIVTKS